jgi:hypothetical protein
MEILLVVWSTDVEKSHNVIVNVLLNTDVAYQTFFNGYCSQFKFEKKLFYDRMHRSSLWRKG